MDSFYNKEVESKVRESQEIYGHDNVAILSNSVGSKDDKNYEEAERLEKQMDIKIIRHVKKKPNVWSDLQIHFQRDDL